LQVLIAEHEAALLKLEQQARCNTQFTCFTSTKVRILSTKLEQQAAAVLDDRERVKEVNTPPAAWKQTAACKETYYRM
jgi:hypothetical protein